MMILSIVSYFKKETKGEAISEMRKFFGYFAYFLLAIIGNLFPAGS